MRKRVVPALLVLFCIVIALVPPVIATVTPDADSNLTLHYYIKNQRRPMAGVTFYVYRVGTYVSSPVNGVYSYELTEDFKGANVDLTRVDFRSAGVLEGLIEVLRPCTEVHKDTVKPMAEKKTDQYGYVTFENLPRGLYLAWGEDMIITESDGNGGERTWTFRPQTVLIPMPYPTTDGFGDVAAEVKYEQFPPDFAMDIDVTVKKVWETAGGSHPSSITVALLRNGELAEEATLSAENSWTHTWTELDASIRWEVWEKDVPDGCTVSVDRNGYYFTITNKSRPDEPPPSDSLPPESSPPVESQPIESQPIESQPVESQPVESQPVESQPPEDDPKLPYTGQLWWPVPLLVAVGAPLFLIGTVLFVRREKPKEKPYE